MSNELLLNLLQAGLLSDLGDDDERTGRASVAAASLSDWLFGGGRPQFASAILGAIDEDARPNGLIVIDRAEECLLEEWPSLRNAFPERPSDLLRAIALQAAFAAATSDEDLEAATWYVLRTAASLASRVGRWAPMLTTQLEKVDAAVTGRLHAAWLPSRDTAKLRMPPATGAKAPTLLPGTAIAELSEALQPYESNLPGNHQHVSATLGKHVPQALTELEEAVKAIATSSADGGGLKTFAESLGSSLRSQLDAQWAVIEASRLRETLLWWRLAGYSEVLTQSYAEVDGPAIGAVAAAIDVHHVAPRVAPVALEHLLASAVAEWIGSKASVTFDALVEAWTTIGGSRCVVDPNSGLAIAAIAAGDPDRSVSRIPDKLTPGRAATMLFRDLQVVRLLEVGGETFEIET